MIDPDLRLLTEKEWDAELFGAKDGVATMLGWTSYHTLRSKGSAPGYPDRTLWRDRLILAELKREGGKPTDRQRTVLDGLARAGVEVYLWTPSDLDEIARILQLRWTFAADGTPRLSTMAHAPWQPGSLWIAGVGRVDCVLGRHRTS